ncbi:MAG: bifunctional fucokinase/L-fucose-1-P-guanylyltransferase [Kiritimatiellaeota bacterium]|nr:bifunctional fucokinase/L-fucose-1-P-guanylyltransferase [Kiritimatiellota bacterium]
MPAAAVGAYRGVRPGVFAASDPPGTQLGSGGGTVHLLHEAWRQHGAVEGERPRSPQCSFAAWLAGSRKLLIHGSGQSRRLPGYAAEGKLRLPIPAVPTLAGQSPDQTLSDIQAMDYGRLFRHAPESYRVMVACGDVLVRTEHWLPEYPEADVVIVGLPATPEEASNHGVMCCVEGRMRFFLQKPSAEKVEALSRSMTCYLDTGIWLLSARAVEALRQRCGWMEAKGGFRGGKIARYEIYDQFGPALGSEPTAPDERMSALSCAVLPLIDGRFYHFGTSRSVFASLAQLASPAEQRRSFGHGDTPSVQQVAMNADVAAPLPPSVPLWIENAVIGSGWRFGGENVVTGVPKAPWAVSLARGQCLDCIGIVAAASLPPSKKNGMALRVYGFDDAFKGAIGDAKTMWMGRSARAWFERRGMSLAEAGIAEGTDIQDAPLFPVVSPTAAAGRLLQWMLDDSLADDAAVRRQWLTAARVSATDLVRYGDVAGRIRQRRRLMAGQWKRMPEAAWAQLSPLLDVGATKALKLSPPKAVLSGRSPAALREKMVQALAVNPVEPRRTVLDDQIVWGRSPARLDLAGGWTDTPPYCLDHGGRVVNVAVNLNGQPPVQAFARVCKEPHLVIHSIDLGLSETIRTTEELLAPSTFGGFSIARAVFRLAGFDPRFHVRGGYRSLAHHLKKEFGGGIELSMLAAIPKGSGLGTSSILSGTMLGVMGELCGLAWSHNDVFARTSALEQMLGSGGGWQDQIGGLTRGVKMIRTAPGMAQSPDIQWLPAMLLREGIASGRLLLYYTGITRVAHNILGNIVERIFLGDRAHLDILGEIGANADYAATILHRHDWGALREAVRRSWRLNQAIDPGTNPASIQSILATLAPWNPAVKLLGAGGGGYMLLLARDGEEAAALKNALALAPPNPRARFVDLAVSETGLEVTRS